MIYNVSSLLTAREGATRLASIENGEIITDRHHFYEVNGPVHLLRTDRTLLVSASVTATVEDTCGRCLGTAKLKIQSEFEEEFEPANRDLMSDRPAPVEPDFDPALVIDARNMLDMTEALGQALEAVMPLAPACSPECKGICPVCFVNRNETACRCDQTPIDPRWAVLAELGSETSNSTD